MIKDSRIHMSAYYQYIHLQGYLTNSLSKYQVAAHYSLKNIFKKNRLPFHYLVELQYALYKWYGLRFIRYVLVYVIV